MRQLTYFKAHEFEDESGKNWFEYMSLKLLGCLDQLRSMSGYRIVIRKTKGAIGRNEHTTSQHDINSNDYSEVRAIDVAATHQSGRQLSSKEVEEFVKLAVHCGFTGVGLYPNFNTPTFHLDVKWQQPCGKPRLWTDIGKYPEHEYVYDKTGLNLGIGMWPAPV